MILPSGNHLCHCEGVARGNLYKDRRASLAMTVREMQLSLNLNENKIQLVVIKDGRVVAKRLIQSKTEILLLAVDRLLKKCGLQIRQLRSIKVGELNGTFSQVRGVLTLVNTLAFVLGIPLWRGAGRHKLLVPEYTHEPNIRTPQASQNMI